MKSWKSQWKRELDCATPKLRQDVLNSPVSVVQTKRSKDASAPIYKRKPFIYGVSTAVAVAIIAVVLCVSLIVPGGNVNTYAFVVEINPAVVISADANGNVTGIVASNADADVILSDGEAVAALKGKPVDEVINWYVDKAAMLGYFDISKSSAVRVSTVEEGGKLLGKVSDALEAYFMDKGIMSFVVADVVDFASLSERCNLHTTNDVKSLTDYVENAEPIFRTREAENLSKEELQQTYRDYVTAESFVKGVGDYLNSEIDKIAQNESDVKRLIELNESIENHPDNRSPIKNYWSVKAFYGLIDFGKEFDGLMSQMEDALKKYNDAYGEDITNKWQLQKIESAYNAFSAEDLRNVLKHFNAEFLKQHISWLSEIIQTVSLDVPFVGLTTLPETATDFIAKVNDIVAIERASREKQFQEAYNKVRDKISESDYNSFKEEMLSQYGSSDLLWENLK